MTVIFVISHDWGSGIRVGHSRSVSPLFHGVHGLNFLHDCPTHPEPKLWRLGWLRLAEVIFCALLSRVWPFATPWTVANQVPLSMGFSRQEYWSGLPFPSPGDLPDPGIKPTSLASPALAGEFFATRSGLFGSKYMSLNPQILTVREWLFYRFIVERSVAQRNFCIFQQVAEMRFAFRVCNHYAVGLLRCSVKVRTKLPISESF